jgi:Fe-S-cluster-containing hydrogenase component 2
MRQRGALDLRQEALFLPAHDCPQGEEEVPTARTGPRTLAFAPARRAFLRAILGDPLANASGSREPLDARQLALLREVAATWAGGLPQGSTPRIVVGDTCANHGTCAAVCPTNALRTYGTEAVAGLAFEPAACIGCGVCAVVCPESALAIEAAAAADTAAGACVLTRHARRECTRCDNPFVVSGTEELCPACRKDVSLFANAYPTRSDAA